MRIEDVMAHDGGVKMKEFDSEIVIIGGGGGGLTAAMAAAEKGAGVVLLEKRHALGGNAVRGGGPPRKGSAQESSMVRQSQMESSVSIIDKRDEFLQKALDWSHYRIDTRLVRTLINKSGDTIRWLAENGLKFTDYEYSSSSPPPLSFGFGPGVRGIDAVKFMIQKCKEFNVRILIETDVKKILTDSKGEVTGVLAETKDNSIRINTEAVIISTGGFLGNKELMKKYFHSYSDDVYNDIHMGGLPHTGDGLLMATEIGAATDGTVAFEWNGNRFPWLPMRLPVSCSAIVEISDNLVNPEPIWVNKKGLRFVNEASGQAQNSMYRQPGKICYTLFDEKIKDIMLARQPRTPIKITFAEMFERELQKQIKLGRAEISGSWDEIAEWIGADSKVLKATIDEYNSCCDKRYDDIFLKPADSLLPLRTPPFYAIKSCLNILLTRGPLKVNHHMEVLDKKDDPIPGLYAAGVDIGGTDSETYCNILPAHSIGFTISSGRIAAESAVEYTRKK